MASPRESLPPVCFFGKLSSSNASFLLSASVQCKGRCQAVREVVHFQDYLSCSVACQKCISSTLATFLEVGSKNASSEHNGSTTASMTQCLHTTKETQNSLLQEQDLLEDCDQFLLPERNAGWFLSLSLFSPTRRSITPISIGLFLSPSLTLL